MISVDASPPQVRRLASAGAWRYLTKPVDVPDVLALLDEVATTDASPSGSNTPRGRDVRP